MTLSTDTQERIDTAALRAALAVEARLKAELEKVSHDIQARLDHYHNANVSAAGAYAATLKNEGKAKHSGPFE
jgi:hypothetical protein